MPWDTLIRGGQVVTPTGVRPLDVAIENGAIVELAPALTGAAREEIDATNLHVFPGLIDAHVHFNEPGRTDWEGFDTGSAALAAGGGTCYFDMPLNAHPPTLDAKSFDLKLAAAQSHSRTDFALWGGLTPDNLDKLEELADRGVVGFKAFMANSGIADFKRSDDWTLFTGMRTISKLCLPVAVHAENDELIRGMTAWVVADGGQLGAEGWEFSRSAIAELDAIQRAILFAQFDKCPLHVVHVSTRLGAGLVADHKAPRRTSVSAETCPHYFMLNDDDVVELGARAKCAPPIRSKEIADGLWQAVHEGFVDTIGSDHSPAPASMKIGMPFMEAWGGVSGVQSTLPALLTREPRLPLERVAALTSTNVAKRFNIPNKGQVAPGFDADLALVDVAAEYTLTRDMLLDRHKLSPYVGRTFRGLVKRTIVRGHTVFRDGRAVSDFRGRLVKPQRGAAHA